MSDFPPSPDQPPVTPAPPASMPPPPPASLTAPPGYVAYGVGNPGAFSSYERIRGLARWIRPLVIIAGVANLLTAVLTFMTADDADLYRLGAIDDTEFLARYAPALLASFLSTGVTIAAGVLVMIWMWRMAKNVRRAGRSGTWGPGWAIGSWFAPPVLYIIPFLMLRELWRLSAPNDGTADRGVSPLVVVWWLLYGVAPLALLPFSLSASFGNLGGNDAEALADQLSDQSAISAAGGVFAVGAAIAFVFLVTQLTARHAALTSET